MAVTMIALLAAISSTALAARGELASGDVFSCEFSDSVVNSMFSDPEDGLDRPGPDAEPLVMEVTDGRAQTATASGVYGEVLQPFRYTYQGGAVMFVHISGVDLELGTMAMLSVFNAHGDAARYRANAFVQRVRLGEPVLTRLSIGWCTRSSNPA
jgi:hypothetical protein